MHSTTRFLTTVMLALLVYQSRCADAQLLIEDPMVLFSGWYLRGICVAYSIQQYTHTLCSLQPDTIERMPVHHLHQLGRPSGLPGDGAQQW